MVGAKLRIREEHDDHSRRRRAAGMESPDACKAGVCSTRRAMLVDGQADMDASYALRGLRDRPRLHPYPPGLPVSDKIVVDFDKRAGEAFEMISDDDSCIWRWWQAEPSDNATPRDRGEAMRLMAVLDRFPDGGAAGIADRMNLAPGLKERITAAGIVPRNWVRGKDPGPMDQSGEHVQSM